MMGNDAIMCEVGTYRYALSRMWDSHCHRLLWVMLNPSTADASLDDPTIKKITAFSKLWGYDELRVVNLFAYRATDPKELKSVEDPIGPKNNYYIDVMARSADEIVLAWGNHGSLLHRGARVLDQLALATSGKQMWCLGMTKTRQPKHPLYLRNDTPLQAYPAEGSSK